MDTFLLYFQQKYPSNQTHMQFKTILAEENAQTTVVPYSWGFQ